MDAWTIYSGDCFDRLPSLAPQSIDAVISDPPYGTTNIAWDKTVDWPRMWAELERIAKPTAPLIFFSAQPFTTDLINSCRRWFRYTLIWKKTRSVGWLDANRRPLRAHETIVVFSRVGRGGTYNPQKTTGHKPYAGKREGTASVLYGKTPHVTRGSDGDRHPTDVLTVPSEGRVFHPTQKPLELMRWLIRSYTNPGDLVLDPFAGSGTTGHAAIAEGRRFIGIEREDSYYQYALARLQGTQN